MKPMSTPLALTPSSSAAAADYDDSGTWSTCACMDPQTQTSIIADYAAASKVQPLAAADVYDFSIVSSVYPSLITGGTNGAVVKNDIEYILFMRKGGTYRKATALQKALSMLTKEEMQAWWISIWTVSGVGASTCWTVNGKRT